VGACSFVLSQCFVYFTFLSLSLKLPHLRVFAACSAPDDAVLAFGLSSSFFSSCSILQSSSFCTFSLIVLSLLFMKLMYQA
jgi:hypothetical protein